MRAGACSRFQGNSRVLHDDYESVICGIADNTFILCRHFYVKHRNFPERKSNEAIVSFQYIIHTYITQHLSMKHDDLSNISSHDGQCISPHEESAWVLCFTL